MATTLMLAAMIAFLASRVRIVKVNLSDEETRAMMRKKHPGYAWCSDFVESLDKANEHIKDVARYMKEHKDLISDPGTFIQFVVVSSTGQEILQKAYNKACKIHIRKADRIVAKYGVNGATEKYFGSFIEDIYFTSLLLDEMKENHFDKEIIEKCKKRAIEIRHQNTAKKTEVVA